MKNNANMPGKAENPSQTFASTLSYIVALAATIVRYYDYALFGFSAAVISEQLMPGADYDMKLFNFFAMFAVTVIIKPFGSILFGKIGDTFGRIVSVKISTLIAAISILSVAFIPKYQSIGLFSVLLLTIFRMMFLLSLSGEIDAIRIYVSEKIGRKRRHLGAGIVTFSSQIGVIIASIAYHFATLAENPDWYWRINFIAGGVLGIIVFLLRGFLKESDAFVYSKSRHIENADDNLFEIIQNHKSKFILAVLINGMVGGGYHFLIIFLNLFMAKSAGMMAMEDVYIDNVILVSLCAVGALISGYVADRVHMVMQTSIALMVAIFSVLFMELFLEFNVFSASFHRVIVFTMPFYTIPCAILLQSIFPTSIRMRMYALSHSVGSTLFSSTTPFMCMLIWRYTAMVELVLVYFLLQLGVLFFAFTKIVRQNYVNMFES